MGMNALVFNVLKEIGINPERFSLQWASAAEAPRFVKLITEFTGKIKELGPLGESEGMDPEEIKSSLEKGLEAVSSRKVRMVYGNTAKAIRKEGIFTQEYISGVIEEKLSKAIVGAVNAVAEGEEKPAPKKTAPAVKEEVKQVKAKKAGSAPGKKAAAPKKAAAKKGAPPAKKPAAKKPAAKKGPAKKKTAAKKKK